MPVKRLSEGDIDDYRKLMELFASEFEDPETYAKKPPSDAYANKMLEKDESIFLVDKRNDELTGGLVAYVLQKFEQERSEVYIYDLAVKASFRRQGIATALINSLKPIAQNAGAWVIYVQADYIDQPAVSLYESLGKREEVLHFDIQI